MLSSVRPTQTKFRLTVSFCHKILDVLTNLGKRDVALPGNWNEEDHEGDGNFQHFVNWKSKFDDTLKLHLDAAPRNATYMSPTIQNELTACCGADILETIVQKINRAKYFYVLADETLDVSGTEQLSICIRHVSEKFEIQEDFLGVLSTFMKDNL